jgi:hypothetical protein
MNREGDLGKRPSENSMLREVCRIFDSIGTRFVTESHVRATPKSR